MSAPFCACRCLYSLTRLGRQAAVTAGVAVDDGAGTDACSSAAPPVLLLPLMLCKAVGKMARRGCFSVSSEACWMLDVGWKNCGQQEEERYRRKW